jgi:hypothetical protein
VNGISILLLVPGIAFFVLSGIWSETTRWAALKYLGHEYSDPFSLKSRYGFAYLIIDRRVPESIQRNYVISYISGCLSLILVGLAFAVGGMLLISLFVSIVLITGIDQLKDLYFDFMTLNKINNSQFLQNLYKNLL